MLVVDDDPALSYTLKEILESEGLDVLTARDGLEGEKAFEASPVPLVVTDLRMPVLDGMGLLRRLLDRAAPPQVIVITAHWCMARFSDVGRPTGLRVQSTRWLSGIPRPAIVFK
ncbi:MAG: response regulator, partial [Polyangiaceae bacterium]|nr:response regulator [Polyangiaceae bacterium]